MLCYIAIHMDIVEGNAKKYEAISKRHDPLYPKMVEAINIVKNFIVDRKLIIYGGTAIDYALRLVGDKIYPDDTLEVPDLDFYSGDSVGDAYDLADILYAAGNKDARAIRALHLQTMRVDIGDKHWIADISYIPPDILSKIPTLNYEGMRIVHPNFQRIDIHNSLSFPFDNPPREVIFARWKKDVDRFNLLHNYYPMGTGSTAPTDKPLTKVAVPLRYHKYVIHGFAAYSLLYVTLQKLVAAAESLTGEKFSLEGIPVGEISANQRDNKLEFLSDGHLDIVHVNLEKLINNTDGIVQQYEPYAEILPERAEITVSEPYPYQLNAYSVAGKWLTIGKIDMSDIEFRFVSAQYLLKYFAAMFHWKGEPYAKYYLAVLKMISTAESAIDRVAQKSKKDADELLKDNPLFLNIRIYGSENISETYTAMYRQIELDLRRRVEPFKLPTNYYPGTKKRPDAFDYSTSRFFSKSGKKIQ